MFHEVDEIRLPKCRRGGCPELACRRYEPGHAWNDFCTMHADEAEAILAVKATPSAFVHNRGPQVVAISN